MDILSAIYSKPFYENERHLRFWEDYLKSLNKLDFGTISDKLTVPVLVPIGSRILFRGELKHTNEVTVALGAGYFTKCSTAQAEILRQHRIKDAEMKLDMYRKEKEYLESQTLFRKENIYNKSGEEIIEEYSEEEDKLWRKQHRENVRLSKIKTRLEKTEEVITDEELWNRLEELELQEELENELVKGSDESTADSISTDFSSNLPHTEQYAYEQGNEKPEQMNNTKKNTDENSKMNLLQKVIDKQNELDEKLQELKTKKRNQSKTEKDLLSRLDEMEQLDELEDEMDRLEDVINYADEDMEYKNDEEESMKSPAPVIKQKVSFADEDDSETIDITFKHSEVLPNNKPYDPSKGLQKPSDLYSAYASIFKEPTSILKKNNYVDSVNDQPMRNAEDKIKKPKVHFVHTEVNDDTDVKKTIVIKDVVERVMDPNGNIVDNVETRPTSLFKKKRMQKSHS